MKNQKAKDSKKEPKDENPLLAPANHHLRTLLAELKRGRPADGQKLLDKWIEELNGECYAHHSRFYHGQPVRIQRKQIVGRVHTITFDDLAPNSPRYSLILPNGTVIDKYDFSESLRDCLILDSRLEDYEG